MCVYAVYKNIFIYWVWRITMLGSLCGRYFSTIISISVAFFSLSSLLPSIKCSTVFFLLLLLLLWQCVRKWHPTIIIMCVIWMKWQTNKKNGIQWKTSCWVNNDQTSRYNGTYVREIVKRERKREKTESKFKKKKNKPNY